MNYNNNMNVDMVKSEDLRNNYLRNNYMPNVNDPSYKTNIQNKDDPNAHAINDLKDKRDTENTNAPKRKYYEGSESHNIYINDNNRNVDKNNNSSNNNDHNDNDSSNNNGYMNYIDKNNIGIQGDYPKKFTNSYYEKKNNENNYMHQPKKEGYYMNNINKNKYENRLMPNNYRNNNNNLQDKPRYKPPMLRNQNMHNKNNFNRMNYNKGASNHNFNRNYNTSKLAWANRDNRRYYVDKEEEIFTKTSIEGVNFELYNSIPIEVSGYNSENLTPIDNFDDPSLNLHNLLLANIKKVNYNKTTPIQKYSIKIIMNKNDLIGVAQTGSGKTAGYLLPIINHMLLNDPPKHTLYEEQNNNRGSNYYFNRVCLPICLILAPTRELAMQIFSDAKKFCFETGIKPVVLYGGSNIKMQLYNLDKGADIIVATPGRLNDILEKKKIRLFLTSFLVLDEADRMLDMGFSPQIRSIMNDYDMPGNDNDCGAANKMEYKKYSNDIIKRQTIMFSATFRKEIRILAKEYLCNYTYLLVGKAGSTHEYIKQNLVYVEEENKCNYLVKMLSESNSGLTILFVETKRKADIIERFLSNKNLNAVCIHGDKNQDERERALKLFKKGIKNILVATDVAARGLDISNIKHVINFDLPSNIDDYIHRIGRTGRAGNIGIATSFVNEDNKNIFKDLLATLEECNQFIPPWFFNLIMKHTASARANRNYRYKTVKNKNNYPRYQNNMNYMPNKNMNNSSYNNNNAYGNSGFDNSMHNNNDGFPNSPYNNNPYTSNAYGNNPYANNYNNNYNSGIPYNNGNNNNSNNNNNKYHNFNQKRYDNQNM